MNNKPVLRLHFLPVLGVILIIVISCSFPHLETGAGPQEISSAGLPMIPSRTPLLAPLPQTANQKASASPAKAPGDGVPVTGTPIKESAGERWIPTPDASRQLPAMRTEEEEYIVAYGDTLAGIARRYWIGLDTLIRANQIDEIDRIEPGTRLVIPAPAPAAQGPGFKILPDADVVYGPSASGLDLDQIIAAAGGYLSAYTEQVDGKTRTGARIIQQAGEDYSVNPLLLLALLEYTGGWLTRTEISADAAAYPLGFDTPPYEGLHAQLDWAANEINRGYYLWRVNGIPNWVLADGSLVPPDAGINAGTAGIQHLFSYLYSLEDWMKAVSVDGLYAVYENLLGDPFSTNYDPVIPDGLVQPNLILPFEKGITWRFTGAPHGAFGGGAAWAALDFAPLSETLGCVPSDAWVTAMADGMIVRSGRGQVIQDLDGDGNEQTGWVLQYLHIETRDRVEKGVFLQAGDRIGHPSCEGAISTGTHVHIARRYNGEWIPADAELPFILSGWIPSGTGIAYNGYLINNGNSVPAIAGTSPENQIHR